MFKLFESKIDKLANRKAKLQIKKLSVKDKQEEVNSAIETDLKKLENLSWRNKENARRQIEAIDREIVKIDQLIEVEKEYVNRINESDNKNK